MRIKQILLFVLLLTLGSSCLFAKKVRVIVDTDCDMDDMMAILYLLKKNNAEVLAITTTGTGMAEWKYSAPNILKLMQLAGHPTIPVSFGAKKSMSPYGTFPAEWRKGVDQVFNIPMPKNKNPPSKYPSWLLMSKIIQESEHPVTILALAPMTNIGLALLHTPGIANNIERIVISGGSINKPGNVVGKPGGYANKCAEYNIMLDAKAAEMVFTSGIPVTLVPLDATEMAPITNELYDEFKDEERNPSANFVFQVIKPFVDSQTNATIYLWDPVAAAVLANPSLGMYKVMNLIVNQVPGPTYGCTLQRPDGSPIRVCTAINSKRFYSLFFNTISRGD